MASLLLPVIYLTFISLGLPDSLLGTAWPVMHVDLGAPVAAQSLISIIISCCTIVSSLLTARLVRRLGTGRLTALSVALTAAAILGFSTTNALGNSASLRSHTAWELAPSMRHSTTTSHSTTVHAT